jgi:hypothetical protein
MSLVRAGVLSHSGHADLSARVGPDAILVATVSRRHDLGPDDLTVICLDGTVAEGDLAEMSPKSLPCTPGCIEPGRRQAR